MRIVGLGMVRQCGGCGCGPRGGGVRCGKCALWFCSHGCFVRWHRGAGGVRGGRPVSSGRVVRMGGHVGVPPW
jgi:hypothetical protein